MAKATNKSPKPSQIGKSARAKKPAKTAIERHNEKLHKEIYEANKEAIDTALRQCCSHLKKLKTDVARETISRLREYYIMYGIETPRFDSWV